MAQSTVPLGVDPEVGVAPRGVGVAPTEVGVVEIKVDREAEEVVGVKVQPVRTILHMA